tara:strand:+ start:650 stop:1144 length:495 start_codon:yes stop_codon:yes gene_type:complete
MYQLTLTIQGMFRYYRELQSRGTDEFAMERLRKTRAEANLAELRLSRERKESLDASAVTKAWENIVLTLRQKLLALPSKIAPRLVYLEKQHDIEEELEKEVTQTLVDLSKPVAYEEEPKDDGPDEVQDGDQESPATAKAAAKNDGGRVGKSKSVSRKRNKPRSG